MNYGTGWFWQPYDHNHAALVPLSTAYPCPSITWHHAETCAVDRASGFGCTCTDNREETNNAVVP